MCVVDWLCICGVDWLCICVWCGLVLYICMWCGLALCGMDWLCVWCGLDLCICVVQVGSVYHVVWIGCVYICVVCFLQAQAMGSATGSMASLTWTLPL